MNKGDIVLIPFPFTDLQGYKNRPAVVLYSDTVDVVVAFLTTKLEWANTTDVLIEPNASNRLKKTSLIRTSKIATLDIAIVLGKIGQLTSETLNELNNKLLEVFDLK